MTDRQRLENYSAVVGPPGTGKTAYLIGEARAAMRYQDVPSGRIGFLTYTKKAAEEGRSRMGVGRTRMPFVGTIHSTVWKCMETGSLSILGQPKSQPKTLLETLFGRLGHSFDSEKMRAVRGVYSLCRHAMMNYDEVIEKILAPALPLCSADEVERYDLHYSDVKVEFGTVDFDDMLDLYLEIGWSPELDLLLIDEAQDLTAKLWRCVEKLGRKAGRVVMAGDDDQMLYRWTGADAGEFERYFAGATVLEQSHRCSRAVAEKAQRVIQPVQKTEKVWLPTDEEGEVFWTTDLSDVPLGKDGKEWFVLCRTNRRVRTLARQLKERRVYYSIVTKGVSERGYTKEMARLLRWWKGREVATDRANDWALKACQLSELDQVPDDFHDFLDLVYQQSPVFRIEDMAYTRDLALSGDDILVEPKVVVLTINQAKGLEADNVVIDLHTPLAVRDQWEHDYSAETRAAYVAVTRAREQVWLYEQGYTLDCYRWGD